MAKGHIYNGRFFTAGLLWYECTVGTILVRDGGILVKRDQPDPGGTEQARQCTPQQRRLCI